MWDRVIRNEKIINTEFFIPEIRFKGKKQQPFLVYQNDTVKKWYFLYVKK